VRNAASTPSARHNPSSGYAVPIGRDSLTMQTVPDVFGGLGRHGGRLAEVAVDRGNQPDQPVAVQGVVEAEVE
jgi:hypothetical protein